MSVYGKKHYNKVVSLQLIKINEKKKKDVKTHFAFSSLMTEKGWGHGVLQKQQH